MSSSRNSNGFAHTIELIRQAGIDIYCALDYQSPLFMPAESIERALSQALIGRRFEGENKTRSKLVKQAVAGALGYPIPTRFKRSVCHFPSQDLHIHSQKASNLQVYNREPPPARRYGIVAIDESSCVRKVRVITGENLARLDRNGTWTKKFQATSQVWPARSCLVSAVDTPRVRANKASLLTVSDLYEHLMTLIGTSFDDPGANKERVRADMVHQLACGVIPNCTFDDSGQFPDIRSHLVEVKFQLARTIDLGLVSPDDVSPIDGLPPYLHCDVRYAVFFGSKHRARIRLDALVLSTGVDFFNAFRRMGGNVVNRKRQIILPTSFLA